MREAWANVVVVAALSWCLGGCDAKEQPNIEPGQSSGAEDPTTAGTTAAPPRPSTSSASATGSPATSGASTSGDSPDDTSEGPTSGPEVTTADESTGAAEGWIDVGWGLGAFNPLAEGDPWPVHLGTQGAYMLSLTVRGAGFVVPPDPTDLAHPDMPVLDLWVDVDGANDDPQGHFRTVVDYPVPFEADPAIPGVYQFLDGVYILLPDALDPQTVEGRATHLHVELFSADGQQLVVDRALALGGVLDRD